MEYRQSDCLVDAGGRGKDLLPGRRYRRAPGQVIDLPVVTSHVTEQRAKTCVCAGCGTATVAACPDMIRAPRCPVKSKVRFITEGSRKHEPCHI